MNSDEINKTVEKLESRKKTLIDKIKGLNQKKRYKAYEKKALEPFVENTKQVKVGPIKRRMKSLEYRISTQAHTPKREREMLKMLKTLESEYSKVKEVERARRKLTLVTADIEKIDKDVEEIEIELKEIRAQLNELYKKQKLSKMARNKGITLGKAEEEFSLMDLAEIEGLDKENKKEE